MATTLDRPDTDGDGIIDYGDRCPEVPQTRNGYHDEDGCEDTIPRDLAQFTGWIEALRGHGRTDRRLLLRHRRGVAPLQRAHRPAADRVHDPRPVIESARPLTEFAPPSAD